MSGDPGVVRRRAGLARLGAASALAALAMLSGCAGGVMAGPTPPQHDALALADGAACLPAGAPGADAPELSFCQVVRRGGTVRISGVLADGPMAAAVTRAYAALGRVLKAQHLTPADVTVETLYATDVDALAAQDRRRAAFYGAGHHPHSELVQVKELYLRSAVLEIEVTARAPS